MHSEWKWLFLRCTALHHCCCISPICCLLCVQSNHTVIITHCNLLFLGFWILFSQCIVLWQARMQCFQSAGAWPLLHTWASSPDFFSRCCSFLIKHPDICRSINSYCWYLSHFLSCTVPVGVITHTSARLQFRECAPCVSGFLCFPPL